jgi:KaiC/GvpD/RAD55 family RecA-like ATPase
MKTFGETPSKLAIKPPEFECDVIISDKITDPLPNTAFFGAIIGSAGSGKTSLLINFLTQKEMYAQAFDHVHLICPKASMKSVKDNIWENHPAEKIHHSLDATTIDRLIKLGEERKNAKPKCQNTLVIIDDMTAFLKHKEVEQKLREMVYNRRHIHISIFILVQSYNAMPLTLRKTLSHFWLFKPRNKKESEAIWEEIMFVDRKTGVDLLRYVFQDKHDFMMGNCNTGDIYRNFSLLDIDGDELDDEEPEPKRIKQEDDSGDDSSKE